MLSATVAKRPACAAMPDVLVRIIPYKLMHFLQRPYCFQPIPGNLR
jgi:hypothetical protein